MIKVVKDVKSKRTKALIKDSKLDAIASIGKTLGTSTHNGRELAKAHGIEFNTVCKRDAYIEFAQKCVPNSSEALMTNLEATAICYPEDDYNTQVGENEAVKKVLNHHRTSFYKAIKRWQVAMLKDIIAVSPETFEEALHEVRPCKCKCNN